MLKCVWPLEATFCGLSLALVWATRHWLRHKRLPAGILPTPISTKLIYGLLVIVLLSRAALFVNNVLQLPPSMGFDALAHQEYIHFIQQKHALPLANDGGEMYQPPLYYLASALALAGLGQSEGGADTAHLARAVNGVIGLLHCWMALLCLRMLRLERPTLWLAVGIGASLGAAMLTKFSALLALPLFAVVLN